MTDDEILKKVIEKAEKNGFDLTGYLPAFSKTIIWDCRFEIIFSHDFAKAFWGDEKRVIESVEPKHINYRAKFEYPAWREHLQRLVLEEEPLKYLAKFLEVANQTK